MTDLEITKNVLDKAMDIALKWVRCRPGAQYSNVDEVFLNWKKQTIDFAERISPSGIGQYPRHSIPISYIEDDFTVTKDSLAIYNVGVEKSIAQSKRAEELKRSDVVIELGKLGYRVEPRGDW